MILRSKYLIDSTGRTTEDAEVVTEGERIRAIRKKGSAPGVSEEGVVDLGYAALLPGLVNAHTHLELSAARSSVRLQKRFTDWLREVVRVTSEWTEDDFDSSLGEGISESVRAGITCVGDISRGTGDTRKYRESGMRVRLFCEVIDFNPKTAERTLESLKERMNDHPSYEKLLIGIGTHTPYTVSEKLLKRCIKLAHENNWMLCIHLAETRAELEFLLEGTGEILDFRKDFGLPPEWKPPGTSPARYLESLGFFERPAMLVHCNYLEEDDFEIIARSNSSVVFCPRSHEYFGHDAHPVFKMLERGINVALGTDSLLSAPTLSVLDEIRFLHDRYHAIGAEVFLKMATTNGVKALGLSRDVGPIEHGCYGDFVGVALSEELLRKYPDPLHAVLSGQSKIIFSMVGGVTNLDLRSERA
ncbi:amidohydrolase family protein [Candidatus Poribacteria bacterium]|nr:amidohydrolase family protein [Candidatus Poribacteria bacterium]